MRARKVSRWLSVIVGFGCAVGLVRGGERTTPSAPRTAPPPLAVEAAPLPQPAAQAPARRGLRDRLRGSTSARNKNAAPRDVQQARAEEPVLLPEPAAPVTVEAAPPAPDASCADCAVANGSGRHWLSDKFRRYGLGCYSHHNCLGCGSLEAECRFIFGSCRQFFGDRCVPAPPHGTGPEGHAASCLCP